MSSKKRKAPPSEKAPKDSEKAPPSEKAATGSKKAATGSKKTHKARLAVTGRTSIEQYEEIELVEGRLKSIFKCFWDDKYTFKKQDR